MSPELRMTIGTEMKKARVGLPSPKKEFRPGQKRTMTVDDAVPLLNDALKGIKSGISVTVHTLRKMEQGEVDTPIEVAEAAEKTYKMDEGRLTKFYFGNVVIGSDPIRGAVDSARTYLSAMRDRKRVFVQAYTGGGSVPWRFDAQEMFDIQVLAYLKDTEIVQVNQPTFGYPRHTLLSFDRSGEAPAGSLLLLRSLEDGDLHAIRVQDAKGQYVADGLDPLLPADWEVRGWAFSYAKPVGHQYPRWVNDEQGIRPTQF